MEFAVDLEKGASCGMLRLNLHESNKFFISSQVSRLYISLATISPLHTTTTNDDGICGGFGEGGFMWNVEKIRSFLPLKCTALFNATSQCTDRQRRHTKVFQANLSHIIQILDS